MDCVGINWVHAFNDGAGSGCRDARDGTLGSVVWDAVALPGADSMRFCWINNSKYHSVVRGHIERWWDLDNSF